VVVFGQGGLEIGQVLQLRRSGRIKLGRYGLAPSVACSNCRHLNRPAVVVVRDIQALMRTALDAPVILLVLHIQCEAHSSQLSVNALLDL